MTILLTRLGRAQPVATAPQTILQRIDAIDGGPSHHWRLADTGAVMAARFGSIAGTWRNTADLVRSVDPITSSAAGGKSTGFGGTVSGAGHGTIVVGAGGIILTAQHTIHQQVQLDKVATKYIMLATDPPTINGALSREFIADGQGGMIPRVLVRDGLGIVSWVGSTPGTVPIGNSFSVDWVQQNGSLRCFINGSEVALTLESDTPPLPPAAWPAAPAGSLFVGTWPTLVSSFNGLMSELAIWNNYVFTSANAQSLAIPQSVVWARILDAGDVQANQLKDNVNPAAHHHPEDGATVQVVDGAGTRGTLSTDGVTLDYAAGATAGLDAAMSWRVSHPNGLSPTVGFTIEVTPAVVTFNPNLPFGGLYYGGDDNGGGNANTQMKNNTERAVSVFFYAERTGFIDRIFVNRRVNFDATQGYSSGDGGDYRIEIRTADANSKLPILLADGGQIMSSYDNPTPWHPTNATAAQPSQHTFPEVALTPHLQVTAGNPYCFVMRNVHPNNTTNYFSTNIDRHQNFLGSVSAGSDNPPDNYAEPVGMDPASITASTPAGPVQGFNPCLRPNGNRWFPYPHKAVNGRFQFNRIGPEHFGYHYSPALPGGQWCGNGHIGGVGDPHTSHTFSGQGMGRIRFRVSRATYVVDGFFIRIARLAAIAGSGVGTTGNLVFRLEHGPQTDAHSTPSYPAGTPLPTLIGPPIIVPHGAIYFVNNAPNGFCQNQNLCGLAIPDGNMTFVPYLWVPMVPTHTLAQRTLTQGQIYNLTIGVTDGLICQIQITWRPDHEEIAEGPVGRNVAAWNDWENDRQIPWQAWEDSRGFQISSNGGATWTYDPDLYTMCGITFRCV